MFYQINDYIMFREKEIERFNVIFIHELSLKFRKLFIYIIRVLKNSDFENVMLNIFMF